jgi:hypothetical protein
MRNNLLRSRDSSLRPLTETFITLHSVSTTISKDSRVRTPLILAKIAAIDALSFATILPCDTPPLYEVEFSVLMHANPCFIHARILRNAVRNLIIMLRRL